MNHIFKQLLFAIAFLLCVLFSHTQTDDKASQKSFGIDDKVPDMVLNDIINYPLKSVKLSSLMSGKMLLIDFWSTNCIACIEAFPKLMKLQEQFKDHLQVLMVTYQPHPVIKSFLEKREKITGLTLSLPTLCSDTILNNLFKHEFNPHCVWIDKSGIVKYITGPNEVNQENISAVLNKEPAEMDLKDDYDEIPYDPVKPLFFKGYAGNGDKALWYSVLTKYIRGMPVVHGIAKDSGRSIGIIFNTPIKEIYQFAYSDIPTKGSSVPNNRTILLVRDTSKYVWEINGIVQWDNCWCYQLITPTMPDSQLKKIVRSDLKRYFGLSAQMERQKKNCWVLTAEDSLLIKSKGGKYKASYEIKTFTLNMTNAPISEVESRFIYNILEYSPFPFIDETHYSGNVDITLEDIQFNDILSINKALAKYKMKLQLEEREINILVIGESKESMLR